jgi:hypothetical protein
MLSRFSVCEASEVIITELWSSFPIDKPFVTQVNGKEADRTTEAIINHPIGLGDSVFHLLHKLFLIGDCSFGFSFGFNLESKIVSIK